MTEVSLFGETVTLLPEKTLLCRAHRALIVADVHAGKTGHLQRAGVPVPKGALDADLRGLDDVVSRYDVTRVIFLGDLFHSHRNNEFDIFGAWRVMRGSLRVELVRGNHERHDARVYTELGIELHEDELSLGGFTLAHEPRPVRSPTILLAGHLHPAVVVDLGASVRERLPCYHLSGRTLVLPAYGEFTGCSRIARRRGDRVWVPVGGRVIELP